MTAGTGSVQPLQSPGLADSDQFPHHQPKIEAGSMHHQSLQDVLAPLQMHSPHAAGFIQVRETSLGQLAAELL